MKKREKSNSFILNTLSLPIFSDIYELSRLMSLSTRLLYVLSNKTSDYYKMYTIPKRSGAQRIINAPSYSMKTVQKWILKKILNKIHPSNKAMAFRIGKLYGCVPNANFHKYSLYTVSIDLSDFFTSITTKQVFQLFKNVGYNNFGATILSKICTLNGVLPQGGVCSPALSNLVCHILDSRIAGLCEKRGITFTRFADDMCFSCDNKDLLKKTLVIVKLIIEDEGFNINEKKTKFFTPYNRKSITGIIISTESDQVSRKLKAPRDKKMQVREALHRAIISGNYSESDRIRGLIAYIDFVERTPLANHISYKDKMKRYIQKCASKIIIYEEVVQKYNENLFYQDIPQLKYSQVILSEIEDYVEWGWLYNEIKYRKEYLKKIKENDICEYSKNFRIDD